MSKTIVVTGASRGIGQAIARHLAAPLQQCNIVAVARSAPALKQLQAEHGDNVAILPGDLGDPETGPAAVSLALQKFGSIDGLVIIHGRLEPVDKIADVNLSEWKKTFDINVFSAVAMIQAALPELRKSKGRIILCSSGASTKAYSGWSAYGASKAVFNSLALALAAEEEDVVTVSVRPGVVDTEMQDTMAKEHYAKMKKEDAERFAKLKQEGKMLRPEQPGNVMARLALRAGPHLSGKFVSWNDKELEDFQDL